MYRQELRFLCSARRLMILYVSMQFHENIINGFQVTERTKNYHCRISKGNNSKMFRKEIWFLCSVPCLISTKVVIERMQNCYW